eukprot:COSAG02_NODE_4090_length_5801_cov_22.812347_4_plen_221_part_00
MHLRARAPAEHPFHKNSRGKNPGCTPGRSRCTRTVRSIHSAAVRPAAVQTASAFRRAPVCAARNTREGIPILINPMCSGQSGPTTNTRVRTRCLSCSGSMLGSCGATAAPTHTQTHSQWQVGGTHEPSAVAARLADDRQRGLGVARSRARVGALAAGSTADHRVRSVVLPVLCTRGWAAPPHPPSAAAERTAVGVDAPAARQAAEMRYATTGYHYGKIVR